MVDPAAVWGQHEGGPHGAAVFDPTPVFDAVTGTVHIVFSYTPSG